MIWTDEKKAKLRELWPTDKSADEIGEILGCTRKAVGSQRVKLELPPRKTQVVGVSTWTDAQIATVIDLWNKGVRTSQIAEAVGKSKNGVIGKAHRLNLPARKSPIKRLAPGELTAEQKRRLKAKTQRDTSRIRPMRPSSELRALDVLRAVLPPKTRHAPGNCCLWPMWDDGEARAREAHEFCGDPTKPGSVYCRDHHDEAYVPRQPSDSTKPLPRAA